MNILHKGQYLSDIMSEIPSNYILSKRIPGCGATTLELDSQRNSIIIVPNVPVIISKCGKYPNLLGAYESVTTSDIINYLKEKNTYKIMTTPESFCKVKTACDKLGIDIYSKFFLLMDECHQLVKDVDYRDDIVMPMNDFFLFKQKALVSATPIVFSDPRFEQQEFQTLEIDADYDYQQNITVTHTYNILKAVDNYLKEHTGKVCFFVNSVVTIYALMKQLNILNESSVYCAPKSRSKLKNEFDFKNCYNEWSASTMKKYNFFTGRFYTAFDLELTYKPDLVIITEPFNSPYTIVDVDTDCIQICGRFRNGINSATHIYRINPDIVEKSRKQIEWEISAHEFAYQTITTLYNSADTRESRYAFGEALETLPFSKFLYQDFTKNWFRVDKEINLTLVTNRYKSVDSIKEWYTNSHFFNPIFTECEYDEKDEKLKLIKSSRSLIDKRRQIVQLLSEIETPYSEYALDFINDMKQIDSFIVQAFEGLGKDRIEELKYNDKKMHEELIIMERKGNKVIRLIKNTFKIGKKYTNEIIVNELTRIFNLLGIHPEKNITGKMILDYYQAVPWRDSKHRGYQLISELV